MNFDDIPNELLLKIFASLSFQDAIQCALVCRKFNNIIVSNFSKFYIDSSPDTRLLFWPSPIIRELSFCDAFVVVHSRGTEFFEYHPFTTQFYRTHRISAITEPTIEALAKIPKHDMLVYSWREDPRQLDIYELTTRRVVLCGHHEYPVTRIRCSEKNILLYGYDNGVHRIVSYAWDDYTIEKTIENVRHGDYQLSVRTGLLAYIDRQKQCMHFIDCSSNSGTGEECPDTESTTREGIEQGPNSKNQRKESIGPELFGPENGSIAVDSYEELLCVSGCGSSVATARRLDSRELENLKQTRSVTRRRRALDEQREIGIYSTLTKTVTARFRVPQLFQRTGGAFSEDSRYLVVYCEDGPLVGAMHVFDTLEKKLVRVDFGWLPTYVYVSIRKFAHEYYIQCLCCGFCKLIKIN